MSEKEEEELQKATLLIKSHGYSVLYHREIANKQHIKNIVDVLENAGYRLEKAEIERSSGYPTGRIHFAVFPNDVIKEF